MFPCLWGIKEECAVVFQRLRILLCSQDNSRSHLVDKPVEKVTKLPSAKGFEAALNLGCCPIHKNEGQKL